MTQARVPTEAWLRGVASDLKIGMLFATRIPLPHAAPIGGAEIARASWTLPVVGALVGVLGTLVYWIAFRFGLPPLVGAALAVTTTLAATGGLHEDGLADTFDGFGGSTPERKLEIMRDSRIGTYGVCALIISMLIRAGALASLADPRIVVFALIAAHGAARATLPFLMALTPPARSDGLSHAAGKPAQDRLLIAGALAIVILGLFLGPLPGLLALILLAATVGLMAWLCSAQIGGQTGDVLGALEQTGEIVILLVALH